MYYICDNKNCLRHKDCHHAQIHTWILNDCNIGTNADCTKYVCRPIINVRTFVTWLQSTHPLVQKAELHLQTYYFLYFKDRVLM